VLVVAATGTVQVGAEMAWEMIRAAGVPALIVVNRMDKENAAYEATVDALREAFARTPIAVAVPIGTADGFRGYVDLVNDSAHEFDARGRATDTEVPGDISTEIERAHAALVDAAAESDDALLEKYLEGTELTDDEVRTALHAATADRVRRCGNREGRGPRARQHRSLPARADRAHASGHGREGQRDVDRM
jgi:elongation factor G